MTWITENEVLLRLAFFFGILLAFLLLEYWWPRRQLKMKRSIRWSRNLSIIAISTACVRVLVPFTAAGVAIYAQQNQMGLLNIMSIPTAISILVSIVLLDLLIYTQHVAFHHIPLLWRLHQVHHIDQEIDVTTGIRFHPIEIILSTFIKCASVLLLGIPFSAVIIFEILLNATAMFNHSNIILPKKVDQFLRLILITPDMHRVHHSVIPSETNSNFGFNLPWWDRIFKTYQAQPQKGHILMEIGLKQHQNVAKTKLTTVLAMPFFRKKPIRSNKKLS